MTLPWEAFDSEHADHGDFVRTAGRCFATDAHDCPTPEPRRVAYGVRSVPDRWAALVTVQAATSWQKASMAIYGPLSSAEVDALAPLVTATPNATLQVMPLEPTPVPPVTDVHLPEEDQ